MQIENNTQYTPANISEEMNNLRSTIQHYEYEVQKVIMKEQSLLQQLELEKIQKLNLEHLVDELRYQISRLSENSELHTSGASKDEIINCLITENNLLKSENLKLKTDLQNQTQETQQYRDCMLQSTVFYEKEIKELKDQKNQFEKQNKILDEKSKKKHSFIQAENSYILAQLTSMKSDIEEKTKEVENLQSQLQVRQQQSPQENIIFQFENEIKQLTFYYQQQLENEHNKLKETCSTYELEISNYKQQIQQLIEKGNQNMINNDQIIKNQIHNLSSFNSGNYAYQLLQNKNKYIEEEFSSQKQNYYSPINNPIDISNTQIHA